MRIHVLGSGAGGGFPQWNCRCTNCDAVRRGDPGFTPRSQSSIAVSADGQRWVLINASPDVRYQIGAFPPLQPSGGARGTGIAAVVLIDAQIDHTTGLLILREGEALDVYCTDMVRDDLSTGFPLFPMLEHYCSVAWHPVAIDGSSFEIPAVPGLQFTAVGLTSKAPPYSPHRHDPHPGDNIGLLIEDTARATRVFYAPGLGAVEEHLVGIMRDADCLLVDGTFWTEDEMQRRGVGHKLASAMGHLPQSGSGGIIEQLRRFSKPRKVLIHINNTNPILNENSPERAMLGAEGIEVSWDGMDIEL